MSVPTSPLVSTARSMQSGTPSPEPSPATMSLGQLADVGELPGHSLVVDARSLGRDVGQIFKKNPELPGIIFAQDSHYAGMISSNQFLKIISRPFGREIFEGRPVSLMLKELSFEALILNYNLGIQNGIENCLSRPKELIYEPFLVVNPEKNMIKVCTVQILMHASAQAAILRNRQMDQILGTVTDGLLLVDRDFRIGSEYSKTLETMLGRTDLAGKLFTDLLGPLLSPQLLPQAVEYLQVLFDKKLIDRLIKSINPIREVMVQIPDSRDATKSTVKHFSIDFERIHNRGEINQILVRLVDITRRVTFAREIEQREEAAESRMKLMLQMVALEPSALKTFLASCENGVLHTLQSIRNFPEGSEAGPLLESIFRTIHRLKGDAALLHLDIYRDRLHRFEDRLEKLRTATLSAESFKLLEPGLEELLQIVQEARSILGQFSKWHDAPAEAGEAKGTGPNLISRLSDLTAEMSARLGKKATLHSMFDETQLPAPYLEPLKDTLVQLVRNSIAHGIETPTRREQAGKPAAGALQVALEKNTDSYEIIFQDDGAGLHWEKIRHRAREMNLPLDGEEDLKNALFAAGFSTADQVTEDCGRGVGLDLIRTQINQLGGKITVHSEWGNYCAFQIILPLNVGGRS